jgi:hypothetical protein
MILMVNIKKPRKGRLWMSPFQKEKFSKTEQGTFKRGTLNHLHNKKTLGLECPVHGLLDLVHVTFGGHRLIFLARSNLVGRLFAQKVATTRGAAHDFASSGDLKAL